MQKACVQRVSLPRRGRLLTDFPISRCGTALGMLWASGAELPFPGCCSPTEALSLVSGESGGFIHSALVHSTCMDRASFIHRSLCQDLSLYSHLETKLPLTLTGIMVPDTSGQTHGQKLILHGPLTVTLNCPSGPIA